MFQPIDCLREYARAPLTSLIVLGAVLLALTPSIVAAPFGVADETAEALRLQLGDRYEVIVLRRGYVVRPTSPEADYEQIEIEERGVLVDGNTLALDPLRELLGDDANILFALAGETAALDGVEGLRDRVEERVAAQAREVEDNIQREAEELDEEFERQRQSSESGKKDRMDTQFSLGSSLTIEKNQSVREAVVIFGALIAHGEIRGDAVVVLGAAKINGRVEGDLTVVGGKVHLGSDAVIDGDFTSIGRLVQDEGAVINGNVTKIPAPYLGGVSGFGRHFDQRGFHWLEFVGTLFSTLFLAVVVGIAALVARKRVGAVAHRASHEPWKSGLVGALVQVLTLPAMMLVSLILMVSIVGIPVLMVLLPLTILVLALVLILGYAGVAAVLGRALLSLGRKPPYQWASLLTVMVGLALIQGWQVVGEGMALTGGWFRFIGYLLLAFGFFFKYLAWTVGLGAVMLDRFSPLPALASSSPRPGSPSFTSPFASPRSPTSSPTAPATSSPTSSSTSPPPPLPWEVEDDPNADREYREAGELMSAAKEEKASTPELSDEEYKDIGRQSKPSPSGSST